MRYAFVTFYLVDRDEIERQIARLEELTGWHFTSINSTNPENRTGVVAELPDTGEEAAIEAFNAASCELDVVIMAVTQPDPDLARVIIHVIDETLKAGLENVNRGIAPGKTKGTRQVVTDEISGKTVYSGPAHQPNTTH